jgi:hypothetical protein
MKEDQMPHKMLRKGIVATLLFAVAMVFGVFAPQTAHAHGTALRIPKSMQAAMVIDCARSAPEAVKKIGACKDKSGAVQPDGTIGEADGNCGYARIELDVVGGADLFLLSHIGNIAIVHWGINWYNWAQTIQALFRAMIPRATTHGHTTKICGLAKAMSVPPSVAKPSWSMG